MDNLYLVVKNHYESVTPIRGKRAVENIRPIRNRSKTHERVVEDVRIINGKEETWYGFRLYYTDVVMLSPTGIIEFRTGGWESNMTAKFINWIGTVFFERFFGGRKEKNLIWVYPRGGRKVYPLLGDTAFHIDTAKDLFKPVTPIILKKDVIDRKVMKEVMAKYKPMIEYTNTMMALSNGLLSWEFQKSLSNGEIFIAPLRGEELWNFKCSSGREWKNWSKYGANSWDSKTEILDIAENGTQEDWAILLCISQDQFDHSKQLVAASTRTVTYPDGNKVETTNNRYDLFLHIGPNTIRDKIASMVKSVREDVWTTKDVIYE